VLFGCDDNGVYRWIKEAIRGRFIHGLVMGHDNIGVAMAF
jgi:hypothetical protein